MRFVYGLTITLSALLLFSVEPMVARALLPALGGSSAVWITALAFFQVALLLGYGYAAVAAAASVSRPWLWRGHLGVLALAALALTGTGGLRSAQGISHSPQWHLFELLTLTVGLPSATLSTTAPLLQAWYARREGAAVPYRLFGLSNLASLAALLAYPTLLEPYLGLRTQFVMWKTAFLVYVALAGALTLRMRSAPATAGVADGPRAAGATKRSRWLPFALPCVACVQLAAVTAHLTQDVASMPLLWVVPLAAYLLSFALAFELPQLYHRGFVLRMLAVLLFALGYFLTRTGFNVPIGISILFFTAELLFAAWFCHAETYALRPRDPRESSRFYLQLAAGGAAGTLAVAVVSPLVTDANLDLPFSFLLTAAVILYVTWPAGWAQRALWAAATGLGVYLLGVMQMASTHDALFRARNFYGAIRVRQTDLPPQAFLSRTLFHGAIQHGMQWFSTEYHRRPLTYYAADSGVGLALDGCCDAGRPRRIGVIGLGAGTLAAYGRPGDQIRFYEINPVVTDVAQHLFTYTRDTAAQVTVVPGDARLSLAAEAPQQFDVLVIDAFSGDSIPVHLLTREALALYERHLAPGGVLAFHISNQYLDLAPVLARLAASTATGARPALLARRMDSGPNEAEGESLASWVLLSTRADFFGQPAIWNVAQPVSTQSNVRLWTDEYTSMLPILRWIGRSQAAHR